MEVAVGIKLVELLLANLPAIIDTAPKLIKYLTDGFKSLTAAWNSEKPSTPEEIDALLAKIVANHVAIQAIP
jgi:hypothetical protein